MKRESYSLKKYIDIVSTCGNFSLSWVNRLTEMSRTCSSLWDMFFIRKQAWVERVISLLSASFPVSDILSSWKSNKARQYPMYFQSIRPRYPVNSKQPVIMPIIQLEKDKLDFDTVRYPQEIKTIKRCNWGLVQQLGKERSQVQDRSTTFLSKHKNTKWQFNLVMSILKLTTEELEF